MDQRHTAMPARTPVPPAPADHHTTPRPSPDAREILLAIADRLASSRPTHTMDEAHRRALVLTHTVDRHGYLTTEADDLAAEVLRHAPPVRPDITRGEYALLLRKNAGPEAGQ
ncbi:hypothetical protein ACWD4V_13935 [Streptomyces tsukubensis]